MAAFRRRLIAFYLPQFHPIPENDQWWGTGFTEWTNVTRARPLFRGHYQPHLPADLGFYDLRLPEVRAAQAELARRYTLEGFCYWHYWFQGKRLLERPFQEVLRSGEPDFPFCLAWANESWSRTWLGDDRQLLQAQSYSPEDDLAHARWLLPVFADRRCLRVHGRPLFLIYRPTHLPQPRRTTDVLRSECVRAGLPEPYLLGFNAHSPRQDARRLGFDGTIDFAPQLGVLPYSGIDRPLLRRLVRNALGTGLLSPRLKVFDYSSAQRRMAARFRGYPYFPTVMVGWDNSPRRGRRGIVVINTTPDRFETGLRRAMDLVEDRPAEEQLVFVNAWNEWAEGNHLEPDLRHGTGFLERVRQVNCA